MKSHRVAVVVALALALSPAAALATERTVVLKVANATCALCGPIVKGTLERVSGVKAVKVEEADDLSGAVATIVFDDALTDTAALIAATTSAGYPSAVLE
jgi:mercuric ion binding protein